MKHRLIYMHQQMLKLPDLNQSLAWGIRLLIHL
jgi:hypothetical protein